MAKKKLPSLTQLQIKKSRLKDLNDQAIAGLDKRFGEGTLFVGDKVLNVESISTGILGVDRALGVGGIPRGRVTEIYGPEGSGKTTLGLSLIATAQKSNFICAFIDMENALDPERAANIGVDMSELYVSQPDSGEQALEITEHLIRTGMVDVVVVDSVAALVPQAEIDGDMGQSHIGLQARLMSQAMRKITPAVKSSRCALVFINQIREKVGIVYGNPEVTPGGRALKFAASVRIEVRSSPSLQIKTATEVAGQTVKVKIKKNKVAAPFKETTFDIMFSNIGISRMGQVLDIGVDIGHVKKTGAFYRLQDETLLGQGREKAKAYLRENPVVASELENKIRAELGIPSVSALDNEPTPANLEKQK